MPTKKNTQTKPPAPEHIGLTFALSQLEDSPLNYLLITLEEDADTEDEASIAIDMRVANRETLELMIEKLLDSVEKLKIK
jgi:hypothetical protein